MKLYASVRRQYMTTEQLRSHLTTQAQLRTKAWMDGSINANELIDKPTPFEIETLPGEWRTVDSVASEYPLGFLRKDICNIVLYNNGSVVGAYFPTTKVNVR